MVKRASRKLTPLSRPSHLSIPRVPLTLTIVVIIVVQVFLLDKVAAYSTPQRLVTYPLRVRKPLQSRDLQPSSHRSATSDLGRLGVRRTHLIARAPSPKPFKVFLDEEPDSLPSIGCEKKPINPDGWWAANIDRYLSQYPSGNKLSLEEFARENGAANFVCQAGQLCHAGQFCAPIEGRAWFVLLAAQQYTAFQKSLIEAVSFAASSARVVGAKIVEDLTDRKAYRQFLKLHRFGMVLTIMAAVAALACSALLIYMPGLAGFAYAAAFSAVLGVAQSSTILASQNAAKKAGTQDPFTQWADIAQQIGNWQDTTQNGLAAQLDKRASAGVSTEAGMYGVLKNGAYFYNILPLSTNDMEKRYKKIIVARVLNHVLKDKRAFVTLGSDPCNKKGENGAFPLSEGWLSYCDKSGFMRNIVFANENQTGNKWYNAEKIVKSQTYGFSVEYITKQSEECQRLYGFDGEPYGTPQELPQDINSPCIMNLPVCDTRVPGFKKWLDDDNTTVMTCRALQKLPV